jgi:hypothetical protein
MRRACASHGNRLAVLELVLALLPPLPIKELFERQRHRVALGHDLLLHPQRW